MCVLELIKWLTNIYKLFTIKRMQYKGNYREHFGEKNSRACHGVD